jgi:hypothetical protein
MRQVVQKGRSISSGNEQESQSKDTKAFLFEEAAMIQLAR